ncbi:hypothetical protein ACA910_013669 [Epithemia clementina (nom. ined.)]
MVLERYLTDVLASQFGHFVEGLDTNQVRLSALWKGQVSLQNVKLRRHALDHFFRSSDAENPIEIAHGHVGTLQLNIPWQVVLQLWKGGGGAGVGTNSNTSASNKKRNRNQSLGKRGGSVSLVLKDVHVLIVPRRKQRSSPETTTTAASESPDNNQDSAEDTDDKNNKSISENDSDDAKPGDAFVTREQEIQAALDTELLQLATSSNLPTSSTLQQQQQQSTAPGAGKANNNASKNRSWRFWLQERLAHILENLTVTVQNIHVRYEDPGSCLGFVWHTHEEPTIGGASDDAVNTNNNKQYRPSFCVGITLKEFTIHSIQKPTTPSTSSGGDSATAVLEEKSDGQDTAAVNSPRAAIPTSKTTSETTAVEVGGSFMTRYKRAAATDLAVYWNSGTQIMSEFKESAGEGEAFYEQAFLAFQNGGQNVAKAKKKNGEQSLSESARTALFGLFQSGDGSRDILNTYVLHPFSPAVTFAVVHPRNRRLHHASSSPVISSASKHVPPSTVEARLPPCRFTVSRDLVEDLGYLRKSFAIWAQSRQLRHLRALVNERPTVSVREDPGAWWRYAYKAVLAIQRSTAGEELDLNEQNKPLSNQTPVSDGAETDTSSNSLQPNPSPPSRHGWHAMANAILARRQYIELYRSFVSSNGKDESIHQNLLEMEREELRVEEVVAFRIHAAKHIHSISRSQSSLKDKAIHPDVDDSTEASSDSVAANGTSTVDVPLFEKELEASGVLSAEHRYRMFTEMKQTLAVAEGGKFSIYDDDDNSSSTTATAPIQDRPFGIDNPKNRLSWTTHISCPEVSLQVNDKRVKRRHRDVPAPVVRLLFAILQEQSLYIDGSWEIAISVGSLQVEDCTSNAAKNPFPNLLGPKHHRHLRFQQDEEDSFVLNDVTHICSGSLRLRRSQHGFRTNEFGSTTWTEVRVLPLEICYATAPVEALVRILNTANLDFAYDYQRLGLRIYQWRERQRKRLLAALSHKQKTIFVNIKVGAPTVLLPDEDSLLIIDLGHLTFGNDDLKRSTSSGIQYDDHWRLEVASIQVQCASVDKYKLLSSFEALPSAFDETQHEISKNAVQQLIEPFSLIFTVSTKFQDEGGERTDFVLVRASLPRLAFNFTSSAIRLVQRLRQQWDERQLEIRSSLLLPSRVLGGLAGKSPDSTPNNGPYRPGTRKIEFNFAAPLLRFRCENDVDGRDCNSSHTNSTPLVDFALRGIEGSWKSSILPTGQTVISREAKLRGVDCVDLYQGAGEEFSLLVSSIAPESILDTENRSSDRYINSTDLVSINFQSSINSRAHHTECRTSSRLRITFHELFVEWNAETIAAVHKAIKIPDELVRNEDETKSQLSEEFFDAEEEDFHDAGSVLTEFSDDEFPITQIPSLQFPVAGYQLVLSSSGVQDQRSLSSLPLYPRVWVPNMSLTQPASAPVTQAPSSQSFEIVFELSKLRVNFNKESRHRRVVSAEMDRTAVLYSSRPTGGYMAKVTLGNFVLSDADSVDNKTLYREIVGLKTDIPLDRGKQASLLQMDIIKNPRARRFTTGEIPEHQFDQADNESVAIDVANSSVRGCDMYFRAQFSPMRFVYLQQLWFEVIDYFFEGVVGYEVWGNKRPDPVPESELKFAPSNANEFAFTRFDVSMEAPVILVPVSYCSTDFLRIETDRITVGNRYDFRPLRVESSDETSLLYLKQQFFNSCTTEIGNVILSSWSGRRLNSSDDPLTAHIEMNWPSGPTAHLNKPKWKVSCRFDKTEVSLLREDYALIQHIVASNFGEGSRHLDEWDALQNLPPLVLERYKEDIMVHFGYDKKDVTPTTFDVSLTLPGLTVSLLQADRSEAALIQCFDLSWDYWKHSDLISRQHIVCGLDMCRRVKGDIVSLLTGQDGHSNGETSNARRPSLTYKSMSHPSGDIERSLDVGKALIDVGYPSWSLVGDFFQTLPDPSFISPENVIQVGDRWYKIAGSATPSREPKRYRSLTWITAKKSRGDVPSQQNHTGAVRSNVLRLALKFPQISIGSKSKSVVLKMDAAEYLFHSKNAIVETDIKTTNMKLSTWDADRSPRLDVPAPLEIVGICAKLRHCNSEESCSCQTHSTIIDFGPVTSALAQSDIIILYDVYLKVIIDLRMNENQRGASKKEAKVDSRIMKRRAKESLLQVRFTSIDITLCDDSKPWLSAPRKLLFASFCRVAFGQRQNQVMLSTSGSANGCEESAEISIQRIDFIDCLQPVKSPFRPLVVATPTPDSKFSRLSSRKTIMEIGQPHTPSAIQVVRFINGEECRFQIDIHKVDLQYNPSVVFALNELFARLQESIHTARRSVPVVPGMRSTPQNMDHSSMSYSDLKMSAVLRKLSVRFNKEKQGRSLIHAFIENSSLDWQRAKNAVKINGEVGDLKIIDADIHGKTEMTDGNRSLFRGSDFSGPFLEVKRISFPQATGNSQETLPDWGKFVAKDRDVDDVLDISLASVDFVYLAHRTAELSDYLLKAFPRTKSASATTKPKIASQRDNIRRCMTFRTGKASLYIPCNPASDNGLLVSGDLLVRTRASPDPVMELEGSVTEILCKMYGEYGTENNIVEDIEILFHLQRSSKGRTQAKCGVSDVQARICYTEYVHLMKVSKENVGRPVVKSEWDFLQPDDEDMAFEEGTEKDKSVVDSDPGSSLVSKLQEVSSNRNVETGIDEGSSCPFELTLALSDVAIILRRNDESPEAVVDYDMVLFRGENFDFMFTSSNEGETAVFSVKRIFAFDLGEQGRVLRTTRSLSATEVGPMPIAVMVEGYRSSEQSSTFRQNDEDTQIMARLDRPRGCSKETRISLVISCLSITALFRPLQELAAFLGQSWTLPERNCRAVEQYQNISNPSPTQDRKKSDAPRRPVSLRIVLHYPRFMFVADEGDPHSRALILRGLALVNASLSDLIEEGTHETGREKVAHVTINGDFQNISSYIRPDVSDVLFAKDSYRMHIEDVLIETSPYMFLEDSEGDANTDEPISLLLPVTMGVEFEQRSKDSTVFQRSVALNMEPVSLMISAEDLQLIRLLTKKWSSSPSSRRERGQNTYEVVFHAQRLGMGLRKVGASVIVDAIHEQPIGIGDSLVAINGEGLHVTEVSPLSNVVDRLKNLPRPLRLTFCQTNKVGELESAPDLAESRSERVHEYRESFDISLAKASLTLIGNEVPILRGVVSTTQMNVVRRNGDSQDRQLAFSSVVAVDYYNLRIWGWEPLMEPGSIKLSADVHDPMEGSKTLTLEAGDCTPTPVSFNITDACAPAINKVLKWDTSPENESLDGTMFVEEAKKAANAALRFAKQQRNSGSKPFLLQNHSGISCAFVIQKKSPSHAQDHSVAFVTVGDYSGLQNYDSSDISEVPAGGECKFRLDRGSGSRQSDGHGRVPSLTVAFQSVFGVTLEPLVDLQIVRSGVTLLPLACKSDGGNNKFHKTVWVSWTVEPRDEMTVLKLSSTFRIFSLLHTQLEIGLEPEAIGNATRSLGVLPVNSDFFLPLWLCLQTSFELSIRPVGGSRFSPLFRFSDESIGSRIENNQVKYVECASIGKGSTWLAASKDVDATSTSITIDCVLTLLNMLPVGVEWEVSKSLLIDGPIDGSTVRQTALKSGESAEILGADDLNIYVRVKEGWEWSPWLSLQTKEPKSGDIIHVVRLTDVFGVPLDIGARIARKSVGFRVTLFAELWFFNATSLDVSFGASAESMQVAETGSKDEAKDDFSTAEAALKEFSSLFETGDTGRGIRNKDEQDNRNTNMMLLPSNKGSLIYEECFEYTEVLNSEVVRRWWASSDPLSVMPNLTLIEEQEDWSWVDSSWMIDDCGSTSDGWETAPHIFSFSRKREFHASHPYRRRRWYRRRRSPKAFVNAFFQRPNVPGLEHESKEKKEKKDRKRKTLQLGIQVNGGEWSLMSQIPAAGVLYGVIRASSSRWRSATNCPYGTYELCYNVSPLDGEWGDFSRLMTISSRFVVRNDSKNLSFEVKQAGADDATATVIHIGGTIPFHWVNHLRPELICVRPCVGEDGTPRYRWSGGFDPLTIGVIPLRVRTSAGNSGKESPSSYDSMIRSVKVESKIRPGTGRTGINISLAEEDERADGCLFRIDNRSLFPVWIAQDGILANPSTRDTFHDVAAGDCLPPNQAVSFALDVPYRQGKYKHRKAATLEELLRVRISLAPLHSRSGIESTKVVTLSRIGSVVRLNPSKLSVLEQNHRYGLQQIRVIGAVTNDGPTRVLRLVMMRKEESLFTNPFADDSSLGGSVGHSSHDPESDEHAVVSGAEASIEAFASDAAVFPTQEEALRVAMNAFATDVAHTNMLTATPDSLITGRTEDDDRGVVISLRISFSGFIFSLVDSSPNEIAVVTLKNLNALASWNTKRTFDSTVYLTVAHFQVDNMLPNSPYPVAIGPEEQIGEGQEETDGGNSTGSAPLLVVGLSFGPRHKSGIAILKSVTIAPRNLAIRADLAFLVRLQKYFLDMQRHFSKSDKKDEKVISLPDLKKVEDGLIAAALSGVNSQRFYFGGLTILPCTIKLSVAPAKALSAQQAALEGEESAAIHRAVRKGDVRLGDSAALLGVKIGHRNATPLAVMRGVVKSIVVDALLRLDGASLSFAGVSLQNHIATGQQLGSILTAHYLASLRQNVPALVGSMSALGNPAGLVRGLGDGVSDFVLEPVKGFQRSVQEMDASYLVDGVARGTLSLARHTVGGFADSAAALAETFSKNMAVLTLDRRYAQKRDRGENLRELNDLNVALGLGSGFQKLARGFVEGVTGVVKAPIRGAEKRGFEGFAKGIGKGLLGLLVKPIIGISDGFTDVMIGVKGAMDGAVNTPVSTQIRPRRALYGRERAIRTYNMADAAASALLMRTRLAGELYMSHVDMGDRVALFSVKRILMLGPSGQELLVLKYKHIESLEIRSITLADGRPGWGIIIILNTPRRNGSEVEVINCEDRQLANEICSQLENGIRMMSSDLEIQAESGEGITSSDASAT